MKTLNDKIKQAKSLGFEITFVDRDERMLEKRIDKFLANQTRPPEQPKRYRDTFSIEEVLLKYQKVVAQRDELLAALQDCLELGVGDWDGEEPSFIVKARAVIAKCEASNPTK